MWHFCRLVLISAIATSILLDTPARAFTSPYTAEAQKTVKKIQEELFESYNTKIPALRADAACDETTSIPHDHKVYKVHVAKGMTVDECKAMAARGILDSWYMPEGKENVQLPIVGVGVWRIRSTKGGILQGQCDPVTVAATNQLVHTSCFYAIPGEHFTMLEPVVLLEIPSISMGRALQEIFYKYNLRGRRFGKPKPACAPSLFLNPELTQTATSYRCPPEIKSIDHRGRDYKVHVADHLTLKQCKEMSNRKVLDSRFLPEGERDEQRPIVVTGVEITRTAANGDKKTAIEYITLDKSNGNTKPTRCCYVEPGEHRAKPKSTPISFPNESLEQIRDGLFAMFNARKIVGVYRVRPACAQHPRYLPEP